MSLKMIWVFASIANVILSNIHEPVGMQVWVHFLFGMFAVVFFYLSWICELLNRRIT